MKYQDIIRQTTFACLAAGAVALSSCGEKKQAEVAAEAPEENVIQPVLRFSAIPDQDTTAQAERYAPAAKWLSEQLGIQVDFVPSSDYAASVDKFATGDIQLAWFGGVSGVQARKEVPGSRAIVAGAKDLKFKSYFVAHESTGLEKTESFPTELNGMKFTFGSSGSTSGCIMPSHFIVENTGQGPMEYFGEIGFSGAHDKTAYQVQDGTYQAGALSFSTYERLVKEGKIDANKCRVIWETPTYADYNFTASANLNKMYGDGFIDKLQKLLVECKDPAVLKAFDRNQFVTVNNATFQGIADVMETVKLK